MSKKRGDILTSDREVAAYGFVLMYMIGEQMIQLLLLFGLTILITLLIALFGGLIALAIAIMTRVWPNYITPWLDKYFGESAWQSFSTRIEKKVAERFNKIKRLEISDEIFYSWPQALWHYQSFWLL